MQYLLPLPEHYSLRAVLLSHGWSGLSPFRVSEDRNSIEFGFLGEGKPTIVQISEANHQISIDSKRKLKLTELERIERMFGLQLTMQPFFDLGHKYDRPYLQEHKMGRMMRAETVFEDLMKLILTTNCSWAFTKKMVSEISSRLGEKVGDFHCFPKPEVLAQKKEGFFRDTIKTGYRSTYIIQTSKLVAQGKVDVESWAKDPRSYDELKKEILKLPGAGPYVAENLLRLLGKYDGLGVDSWVRGQLKKKWNMRKNPTDQKILKEYKNFGEFKGLMLWCDVTLPWHNGTGMF